MLPLSRFGSARRRLAAAPLLREGADHVGPRPTMSRSVRGPSWQLARLFRDLTKRGLAGSWAHAATRDAGLILASAGALPHRAAMTFGPNRDFRRPQLHQPSTATPLPVVEVIKNRLAHRNRLPSSRTLSTWKAERLCRHLMRSAQTVVLQRRETRCLPVSVSHQSITGSRN